MDIILPLSFLLALSSAELLCNCCEAGPVMAFRLFPRPLGTLCLPGSGMVLLLPARMTIIMALSGEDLIGSGIDVNDSVVEAFRG